MRSASQTKLKNFFKYLSQESFQLRNSYVSLVSQYANRIRLNNILSRPHFNWAFSLCTRATLSLSLSAPSVSPSLCLPLALANPPLRPQFGHKADALPIILYILGNTFPLPIVELAFLSFPFFSFFFFFFLLFIPYEVNHERVLRSRGNTRISLVRPGE
jgi:hypothetical protein